MRKVFVRGTTGSGKSTLARALAERLGVEHVEMDAIHHLPKWTERPREETKAIVEKIVQRDGWVVDGNYSFATDEQLARADCVVWMDFAFPVVFGRLLRRTIHRGWKKEELWHGNTESLRTAFFSRESILLWCIKTHWKNRRKCKLTQRTLNGSGVEFIRLMSPLQADLWLESVEREASRV